MTKETMLQRITLEMGEVEKFEIEYCGRVNPESKDYYDTLLKIVKKAPDGWFECPCEDCRKCGVGE